MKEKNTCLEVNGSLNHNECLLSKLVFRMWEASFNSPNFISLGRSLCNFTTMNFTTLDRRK